MSKASPTPTRKQLDARDKRHINDIVREEKRLENMYKIKKKIQKKPNNENRIPRIVAIRNGKTEKLVNMFNHKANNFLKL